MSQPAAPAGRITVVTDEPLEVAEHPGVFERARVAISRRRWLPPAAILGSVAAYLLTRRR